MQAKEEKAKKLIQDNTKAKSKMTKAERAMKEKEKKEKVRSRWWLGCRTRRKPADFAQLQLEAGFTHARLRMLPMVVCRQRISTQPPKRRRRSEAGTAVTG